MLFKYQTISIISHFFQLSNLQLCSHVYFKYSVTIFMLLHKYVFPYLKKNFKTEQKILAFHDRTTTSSNRHKNNFKLHQLV